MLKNSWVVTLVAILVGQGTPARAQDYEPCEDVCKPVGSIFVDFLMLRRVTTQPDVAFTSNYVVPGVGGPGDVTFNRPNDLVPRFNLNVYLSDDWSINGSFYRLPSFRQVIGVTNTLESQQLLSAAIPFGPATVNSTTTGGGP